MAGSQPTGTTPTPKPPRKPRNRANPQAVAAVAPQVPPVILVNGTAPAPQPAPVVLAPKDAQAAADEADLRLTMSRLLGSSATGGQIIAKRVVGGSERWLCNMGTAAWDEEAFATKYGAGEFALYIYAADGTPRGRIPWAVDDSVGPGVPPAGAQLAANQHAHHGGAPANGQPSENALVSMVAALTGALATIVSNAGKGNQGGFTFADYIKLEELREARRPKLGDIDSAISLGLKVAGAASANGEAPWWAHLIEGAIPVVEPISRALSMKLAGGGMGAPQRPQLGTRTRPQLGTRRAATNGQVPNGQSEVSATARSAGGAQGGEAGQAPGGGSGAGSGAGGSDPHAHADALGGSNERPGAGHGGDGAGDGDSPSMTGEEIQQRLSLVVAMIAASQPKDGEEDERDPVTYANIVFDSLGLEGLSKFAAMVPAGQLGNLIMLKAPALKPSLGLLGEVETELRAMLEEAKQAEAEEESPVVGRVGAQTDKNPKAAQG